MGKFFNIKYFKTSKEKSSLGNCALCGEYTFLSEHHKITVSKGGTDEDKIRICARCHDWVHRHPTQAEKLKLYIRKYKNEKGITKITS
jgi:hypothetical protein